MKDDTLDALGLTATQHDDVEFMIEHIENTDDVERRASELFEMVD